MVQLREGGIYILLSCVSLSVTHSSSDPFENRESSADLYFFFWLLEIMFKTKGGSTIVSIVNDLTTFRFKIIHFKV